MNPIFLIIGPPAVGKSTASRALAAHFSRSIHIPVDDIRNMVVSGIALPGPVWTDALVEQLTLARGSVAQMALAYQLAGFTVVIDDFWDSNLSSDYRLLFLRPHVRRVILYPQQSTAHQRNWNRSSDPQTRAYLDQGIEDVYGRLAAAAGQIAEEQWLVVDTTALSVEETVRAILNAQNGL